MIFILLLFFPLTYIFLLDESQWGEPCTLTTAILVTIQCYIWKVPTEMLR